MIKRIHTTYHFHEEDALRREIDDIYGLLSLRDIEPLSDPEQRSLNAMTEGFTAEQFSVFSNLVHRAIMERRERHTGKDNNVSRAVLEQLRQISKRWGETWTELVKAMNMAREVNYTGLEQSRSQRVAATKAAHFSHDTNEPE